MNSNVVDKRPHKKSIHYTDAKLALHKSFNSNSCYLGDDVYAVAYYRSSQQVTGRQILSIEILHTYVRTQDTKAQEQTVFGLGGRRVKPTVCVCVVFI